VKNSTFIDFMLFELTFLSIFIAFFVKCGILFVVTLILERCNTI
jgi:hypothetical protein